MFSFTQNLKQMQKNVGLIEVLGCSVSAVVLCVSGFWLVLVQLVFLVMISLLVTAAQKAHQEQTNRDCHLVLDVV